MNNNPEAKCEAPSDMVVDQHFFSKMASKGNSIKWGFNVEKKSRKPFKSANS